MIAGPSHAAKEKMGGGGGGGGGAGGTNVEDRKVGRG